MTWVARMLALGLLLVALPALAQTAAPAIGATRITPEALETLLRQMGYEPKISGTDRTNPVYGIVLTPPPGWRIPTDISLSKDRSVLWIVSTLKKVPDPAKAPASVLLKLLEENDRGRHFFSLGPQTRLFYLNTPVDNLDVTPVRLKGVLDYHGQLVPATEGLWDPAKWAEGGATSGGIKPQ